MFKHKNLKIKYLQYTGDLKSPGHWAPASSYIILNAAAMTGSSSGVGFINLTFAEILQNPNLRRLTYGELQERGYLTEPVRLDLFSSRNWDCGVFNNLPDYIQHAIVEEFVFGCLEDILE